MLKCAHEKVFLSTKNLYWRTLRTPLLSSTIYLFVGRPIRSVMLHRCLKLTMNKGGKILVPNSIACNLWLQPHEEALRDQQLWKSEMGRLWKSIIHHVFKLKILTRNQEMNLLMAQNKCQMLNMKCRLKPLQELDLDVLRPEISASEALMRM